MSYHDERKLQSHFNTVKYCFLAWKLLQVRKIRHIYNGLTAKLETK